MKHNNKILKCFYYYHICIAIKTTGIHHGPHKSMKDLHFIMKFLLRVLHLLLYFK